LACEEEHVGECCALLNSIVLHVDAKDMWLCYLHVFKRYNVNNAYYYLLSLNQNIIYEKATVHMHAIEIEWKHFYLIFIR
jgi:hypothetical protein